MDSIYPEPLSRLHRRTIRKKIHKGNGARYKTQPVTFAEIQEVDEETVGEELGNKSLPSSTKSELDLKAKFEKFKRQMDKDTKESGAFPKSSDGQHGLEDGENSSNRLHCNNEVGNKTLSDGRDKVEKKQAVVQYDRDRRSSQEKSDLSVPAIPSVDSTIFDALTQNEKYIFFATLKNASAKKKERFIVRPSQDGKDVLKVAVNVISKDNKRIEKSDKKRKQIQQEELEDEEEDRFLLSILERREQQDASTKTVSSTKSSAQDIFRLRPTEAQDCARHILSVILNRIGTEEPASEYGRQENEIKHTSKIQVADEIFGDERPSEVTPSHVSEIPKKVRDLNEQFEKSTRGYEASSQDGRSVDVSEPQTSPLDLDSSRRKDSEIFTDKSESQKREGENETFESGLRETRSVTKPDPPYATIDEVVDSGEIDEEKQISTSSVDVRRSAEEAGSFAEDEEISERKRKPSRSDSETSKTSAEFEETEEEECVAIRDKRLIAPKSRVRTLQDLLKDRAVLAVDSSDRFRIEWLPRQEFLYDSGTEESSYYDSNLYEEESRKERKKNKILFFLQKICTCGRKESEKEDVVAENLKGESVSVETAVRQRNAASATLDDATMEVLEAAKRKRIIAQYSKRN